MTNTIYSLAGCAALAALLALTTGCGEPSAQGDSSAATSAAANIDTSRYILAEEPDGAISVVSARKEAKDGDEVVLMGRIGGNKKPWIEGRSAFTVIDASMTVVADGAESDGGELCLDDCCAALRADCTTLVKLVDEQGKVLPVDARQILQAEANDLVVMHGRIQRDEKEGTFMLIADGIHVRR